MDISPKLRPIGAKAQLHAGYCRRVMWRWSRACETDVIGVKSYPRGVTTNSSAGIEDYGVYYPVFRAMEEEGMVLNLHGEVPSDPEKVRLCA